MAWRSNRLVERCQPLAGVPEAGGPEETRRVTAAPGMVVVPDGGVRAITSPWGTTVLAEY